METHATTEVATFVGKSTVGLSRTWGYSFGIVAAIVFCPNQFLGYVLSSQTEETSKRKGYLVHLYRSTRPNNYQLVRYKLLAYSRF